MVQAIPELAEWLEQDEAKSRLHRAHRLQRLLQATEGHEGGIGFAGGLESAQVYHELRLAYLNGLYLSAVLLGLACIERELAGKLYVMGCSDARAKLETLIAQALERQIISEAEAKAFNRLRSVRNAYAHFREPLHATTWTGRALTADSSHDDVLAEDATLAIDSVGTLLSRGGLAF